MTMSVVDGIMGANLQSKEPSANAEPGIYEIGNAFARQYYQVLCEDPKNVHKFYGHESTLLMNDHDQVSGQEKIGRLLEDLVITGKSNRVKVHIVKGTMVDNNKILILVFGDMAGRRFTQTFLLASQGLKKYYIQNDVFVFCDLVFLSQPEEGKGSAPSVSSGSVATATNPVTVEKTVAATSPMQLNGHRRFEQVKTEESPIATTPEKPKAVHAEHVSHDERPSKRHTPRKEEHAPKKKEEIPKSEPVPEPVKSAGPKTWANVLGGGSNAKTSVTIVPAPLAAASRQFQPKPTPKPAATKPQPSTESSGNKTSPERTLFVGGIQRNIIPENPTTVEAELKQIFSEFGDVEIVSVPLKSLGKPGETNNKNVAFAFVTMKTVAELNNVLAVASKGEKDSHYRLPLKISSFGHDGEVNLSEQKNHDRERYNNNRGRGGFRGGFNGNFRGHRGGRGSSRGNNNTPAQN